VTDVGLDTAAAPARPAPPTVARRLRDVMVVGALLAVVVVAVTVAVGIGSLDVAERGALTGTGVPGPVLAGAVVGFAAVVGLVEAGLWALGARLLVRGYAWARWTATVLGVATLAVEGTRTVEAAWALGRAFAGFEVVLVIAMLVLLWSPAMSRYVRTVSRWRAVAAV